MRRKVFPIVLTVFLITLVLFAAGYTAEGKGGQIDSSAGGRQTIENSKMPEAPGTVEYRGEDAAIDASNVSQGYVMVKYTGSADKVRIRVTLPNGTATNYPFEKGSYHAIPLSGGSGNYTIVVYAHISGNSYSIALSQNISAKLENEFGPFLYPNQYVEYTNGSMCVRCGREISDESDDDFDYMTNVFNYVTENIKYDKEMAANIPVNYLPDPDRTMETKKGICFDYVSLMTAMLRSQGIPAKLEVGYSGNNYHAWIRVYLNGQWINEIIDPTLAASNDRESARKYMENENNYVLMYEY